MKIAVATDDIFKITGTELSNKGINIASINPTTFQLFTKGTEIPLLVSGGNDNLFNEDDYLIF